MKISTENSDYSGDFNDWGKNPIANGGNFENLWRTLSSAEWTYLLNTENDATDARTQTNRFAKANVKGVNGLLIFPDGYNGTTAVTGIDGIATVNTSDASFPDNSVESSTWTTMESAGCVFLPAAGYRVGSSVFNVGDPGDYWSSTANDWDYAYLLDFFSDNVNSAVNQNRCYGFSVRQVIAAQ